MDTAYKKMAYQSSVKYNNTMAGPSNVVNDNHDNNYRAGNTCCHTKKDFQAWWAVDLGDTLPVAAVRIRNRGDGGGKNCRQSS